MHTLSVSETAEVAAGQYYQTWGQAFQNIGGYVGVVSGSVNLTIGCAQLFIPTARANSVGNIVAGLLQIGLSQLILDDSRLERVIPA